MTLKIVILMKKMVSQSDTITINGADNLTLDGGLYKELTPTPTPTTITQTIYVPTVYNPTPTPTFRPTITEPTPTPKPTITPEPIIELTTPTPQPTTIVIEDDIVEANQEDSITVINVLNNDLVNQGVSIKLVRVTDGDIISYENRAVSGTNLETTDSIVVPGEGEWKVEGDKIVFVPEKGFNGTPTPIHYVVEDEYGNYSNLAKVIIEGNCICKPFESNINDSVPINNLIIFILLLLNPTIFLFIRKKMYV